MRDEAWLGVCGNVWCMFSWEELVDWEGVDKEGWDWVNEGSGAGRMWEGLMIWERVGMELGRGW